MPLHVSLLGAQSITDDATGAVRSRSSRTLALVAYLALHAGSPQTRQRIAGLFWPDSTDAQALTNLRRELHHLRRALARRALPRGDRAGPVLARRRRPRGSTCATSSVERARPAAAAAGDAEAVLAHAEAALAALPAATCCPACTTTGCSTRGPSCRRSACELCALVCRTRAARGDLRRGAGRGPAADPAARRWRRPATATLMQLQADLGDRAGARSAPTTAAPRSWSASWASSPDDATRGRCGAAHGRARAGARRAAGRAGRPAPVAAPLGLGRARRASSHVLRQAWQAAAAGRPGVVARPRAAPASARAGSSPSSPRRPAGPARSWPRSPVLRHRRAGWRWPRSPTGCAARPCRPRPDAATRCGAPRSSRLVPSGTGPGAARCPGPGHGRRLAAAPLLRGAGPGAAGRRPADAAGARQPAVVRPGDAGLPHLLPRPRRRDAPVLVARDAARRRAATTSPTVADWVVRMRAAGHAHRARARPVRATPTPRGSPRRIRGRPLPDGDRGLLHAATGGFPLYVVEAMRAAGGRGRQRCRPATSSAVLRSRLDQASAGRAGGRRAGRRGRPGLRPRPALRGQRPRRRQRGRARSTSCGGCGSCASAATATTSPTTCCATPAYERVSPPRRWLLHRRLAQGLELLHADDIDPVAAQLAEQYARGGRPERARRATTAAPPRSPPACSPTPRRSGCTTRRWRSCAALPAGTRPRPPGARRPGGDGGAAQRPLRLRLAPSCRRCWSASVALAERSAARTRWSTRLVGLWSSRFVQGRIARRAPRPATRALAPRRARAPSCSGAAHFAFAGSALEPGQAGRGAAALRRSPRALADGESLSVGTRPDVHGRAWSAHAHWLLGDDDRGRGQRAPRPSSAARSVDHPYSLAVALAYAAHHPAAARRPGGAATRGRRAGASCATGTASPTTASGGWCSTAGPRRRRGRHRPGPARASPTCAPAGAFARMPYWLVAAGRPARPDRRPRRGPADPGRRRRRARAPATTCGGCPRCCGCAPRTTSAAPRSSRLRAAADLAAAQGSVALLRRCERDLAALGVRRRRGRSRPDGERLRERCANAAFLASGHRPTRDPGGAPP